MYRWMHRSDPDSTLYYRIFYFIETGHFFALICPIWKPEKGLIHKWKYCYSACKLVTPIQANGNNLEKFIEEVSAKDGTGYGRNFFGPDGKDGN